MERLAVDQPENSCAMVEPGRLRLLIAYDGRPFQGWQSQARGNAVQDHLERAFTVLCGPERIAVHGSGRTDAGVHARGQVAHVDVPDRRRFSPERWRGAVNAHLPPEIRLLRVCPVSERFHARYSACGKVYRYRIWNGPILSPFWIGRAWHFPAPLDMSVLREATQLFVGTHDFAAFAAKRGASSENTVRTIRRVEINRRGESLSIDYEGTGFLYKMVRLLTGSALRCAQGRTPVAWLGDLLTGTGKTSFAAPAEGLYLMRVYYRQQPLPARPSVTA